MKLAIQGLLYMSMSDEQPNGAKVAEASRRQFLRDAVVTTAVTCFSPGMFVGCQSSPNRANIIASDTMDEALEMMANLSPLTNHGPMAAEALVAIGRPEKVIHFVERYKKRFTDIYPKTRQTITTSNWRDGLGDGQRVADWTSFFHRELKEASWKQVVAKWSDILAPGLAAAAAHGLLRTAHAVRSLSVRESDLRIRELAEGLGYWAAYYQTLPESQSQNKEQFRPATAISQVPLLPPEKRAGNGSIMVGLQNLKDFPQFSKTADLAALTGSADKLLSETTETFADVYVKNVTQRNYITLIHAVTGTTCLRSFIPYLPAATTKKLLRYGWQMAAGLYSISGNSLPNKPATSKEVNRDDLISRSTALNEEHAIKFTEACLREYAINPKPVYLHAASDALDRIGPA